MGFHLKKVLVTGACGYLGARLSKHLSKNGYSITAFDSFNPYKYSKWTSLMEDVIIGDIRDETTLSNLAEKQFDVAIHLISLDHHKSEDDPNLVSSINVMPTWNLLDKLTKNGLEKFIYFSTIQVYGDLPIEIITEDWKPEPKNAYGLTHLLSENICKYYNEKTETECINVRLSNSYGSPIFKDNNCWWLVINELCKTVFEDKMISLLSDGSPQRDFIHIFDVCRAIEIIIKSTATNFKNNIFHIASGKTYSILELAHMVKSLYTKRYQKDIPIYLPDNSISDNPAIFKQNETFTIDITKIRSLNFQHINNLADGIDEIFCYLEKNFN